MAEMNVRSDTVDVEQIMRQIRARIREKRGVDYTEAELQQLASVKLETFLDPRGVRSDLVEQFKKHRVVSPPPQNYEFEDTTLYETHRGVLRAIRKLLNPILKLFFNPNRIVNALHIQAAVNAEFHKRFRQREEMDPLFYEVIHNLVVEVTRLSIEVHNLKMRVESLSSRIDFDERRGRSLENVVQYKRSNATSGSPSRPRDENPPVASAPGESGRAEQAPRQEMGGRNEGGRQDSSSRPEGGRQGQEGGRPEGGRQSQEGGRPKADDRARRADGPMAGGVAAGVGVGVRAARTSTRTPGRPARRPHPGHRARATRVRRATTAADHADHDGDGDSDNGASDQ